MTIVFKNAQGKPKKLESAWKILAEKVDANLTSKDVRTKYNILFSNYKKFADQTLKSGAGRCNWCYWDVFKNTLPKNTTLSMPAVQDIGNNNNIVNEQV